MEGHRSQESGEVTVSAIQDEIVRRRMEDFLIAAGEKGIASGTVYCHANNVEQFQRCAPPGIIVKPMPDAPQNRLIVEPEND